MDIGKCVSPLTVGKPMYKGVVDMVEATVTTKYGNNIDIQFEDLVQYRRWRLQWKIHPDSTRLVHGWDQSVRQCDITRVILKNPKIERGNFKC